MKLFLKISDFLKTYFPMFSLFCFSGNPIITGGTYSKNLLIGYTAVFVLYTFYKINLILFKKIGILLIVIGVVLMLAFFQNIKLGFVSYPGILGFILKLLLGFSVIVYYENLKLDFIEIYIKTITFLAIISIPFWLLNQFGFYGYQLESVQRKSLLLYTSLLNIEQRLLVRNSGMFWEPGAFAGYLLLGLVFIVLKNRKFKLGPYRNNVIIILLTLFSTTSTTGFIVLGMMLLVYSYQNFRWGRLIVIPLIVVIINIAYVSLDFLQEKIEKQFAAAAEMDEKDTDPSRFGAFKMDLTYIQSQPLTGNGLHVKTRYRFHPFVKGDIGHGNGMSNFIACWGIPFFLVWLSCVYLAALKISHSVFIAICSTFIIVLLMQGEQYLNYPLFLSFFFIPFLYRNILKNENKQFLIKEYFNLKTGY